MGTSGYVQYNSQDEKPRWLTLVCCCMGTTMFQKILFVVQFQSDSAYGERSIMLLVLRCMPGYSCCCIARRLVWYVLSKFSSYVDNS